MHSDTTLLIVIVLALVVVGAVVMIVLRRRGTKRLKTRFGAEYARTVEDSGGRGKAEADLKNRVKRVAAAAIRPLTPGDRQRYNAAWVEVQAHFVDDPKRSVGEADALLGEVMSTRGYAVGDFEQRSGDVSVDHPKVMEDYHAAHAIVVSQADTGPITEDLRRAMILYRSVFDDLVGAPEATIGPATT